MVIAPANTGSDSSSRITVTTIAQQNNVIRSNSIKEFRILVTVQRKLIAPRIEEIPAMWSEKIARSTEAPLWATFCDRGGYTVQPVPAPDSTVEENNNLASAGGSSHNLILLRRGKAISGIPTINGTSQLPKPPIIIGITMKKIITKAWAVTTTLYNWSFPIRLPGCLSSVRIIPLKPEPTIPAHNPNMKYKVPISLWFVDINHRAFLKRPTRVRKSNFQS